MTTATKRVPRSKTPKYRAMYAGMKQLGYEFLIDATGVRRRLEALQCLGWSLTEVGERIGKNQQNMSKLATGHQRVYRETYAKVCAVYDELSMTPNTTRYAERTRALARSRGYVPPLAWDGQDIDDVNATPKGVRR